MAPASISWQAIRETPGLSNGRHGRVHMRDLGLNNADAKRYIGHDRMVITLATQHPIPRDNEQRNDRLHESFSRA